MAALAGLLSLVAWAVVWIVVARKGGARGWGGLKRHGLGAVIGFVCSIVVSAVIYPAPLKEAAAQQQAQAAAAAAPSASTALAPEEQAAKDKAERIASIVKSANGITEAVEPDGEHLVVTQFEENVWSEKAWASIVAVWTPVFMEKVAKEHPGRYKAVAIRFVVPTTDKYGNSDKGEALTLEYDMAEMAKVNWDGISAFNVLNLAQPSFHPIGRTAFLEWCADGNNGKHADEFCAHAVTGG